MTFTNWEFASMARPLWNDGTKKKHMYSMKYVNNNNTVIIMIIIIIIMYICLYKGSVDKTTQPARSWPTRRSSVLRPAFKGLPRGHRHFFHDPMTPQITTKAMALPLQVAKGFLNFFVFPKVLWRFNVVEVGQAALGVLPSTVSLNHKFLLLSAHRGSCGKKGVTVHKWNLKATTHWYSLPPS